MNKSILLIGVLALLMAGAGLVAALGPGAGNTTANRGAVCCDALECPQDGMDTNVMQMQRFAAVSGNCRGAAECSAVQEQLIAGQQVANGPGPLADTCPEECDGTNRADWRTGDCTQDDLADRTQQKVCDRACI